MGQTLCRNPADSEEDGGEESMLVYMVYRTGGWEYAAMLSGCRWEWKRDRRRSGTRAVGCYETAGWTDEDWD